MGQADNMGRKSSFFCISIHRSKQPKGTKMHGLQTMKYLNEQAAAQAIMAKHEKVDIDPVFAKAVEEALAAKAKNITE